MIAAAIPCLPGADWLWACDAEFRVDVLSPEFAAATGHAPQVLLGRPLAAFAAAGAGPVSQEGPLAAIAAQRPFRDLVCMLGRTDGEATWIEIAGTPVFAGDAFHGYRGTGKDAAARVEEALQLQRCRQLFEVASDWFWETDALGRLTYVSPKIEAVLGRPVSSYLGKRLADMDGVHMEPEVGRAGRAAIEARRPYRDLVYSRELPGGGVAWISISGLPHYGADGSFLGYRGIAREVTAQVEAERALREREAEFRQVLDAAADYYWENDEDFRTRYLSPGFEALSGMSIADAFGKRLSERPEISIDPEMGKMMLLAFRAKKPFRDFVFTLRTPQGKTLWLKTSGAPVYDRSGVFRGYRGVGADITKHAEAEALARLGQQRLHEAVAHVTQPIVVYDADDRIVGVNQVFFDLHRLEHGDYAQVGQGASFTDVAGWQLRSGFYADGPNDLAITLDLLLARYRSEAEHTYHLRDGRWMMVVYHRLPGDGRVGVWTDITAVKRAEAEQRRFEAQLHHAQRLEALGTLAGGAAHEINNALVPVIALTKLLARKLPPESRDRRNLDLVVNGAERSRDLVKQILAFSRKEDIEAPHTSVDFGALLRDTLRLMRATVPTSIRFEEEIAPTPAITGDASQLRQVIVNLVTNAAQAIGPEQGSISVTLLPEGRALRLSIADTGCGMDEATLERVFQPFFTTKPVGEGTGLGLSVAHGIVAAHGGRIEVTSAPGRGTRFDIILS